MAAGPVSNVIVFAEDWAIRLQEQLDEPNKWKKICKVEYTSFKTFNNPYHADATVQTHSIGTPYTMQALSQTNETVVIATSRILPQFVDRADLGMSGYQRQMELANRQGILINEAIETSVYANHANFTNFGAGDIAGGTVADTVTITPSATNIDDIVRHVKRVIRVANGETFLERFGGSIVWRPGDFELLEGFMMANGFVTADRVLAGGPGSAQAGVNYMGLTHYSSNLLAANHVLATVNNVYHLAILRDTYGQIMVDDKDPGLLSGISVVSRADYQPKVWTNTKPVDICGFIKKFIDELLGISVKPEMGTPRELHLTESAVETRYPGAFNLLNKLWQRYSPLLSELKMIGQSEFWMLMLPNRFALAFG